MDQLQSAYRKSHSTETAMLKVKADMDAILDEGDAVLLVLLDQSAAFDTIHHGILLERLESEVGIKGMALAWIHSYLTERRQRVVMNDSRSGETPLSTGIPQGSVLGPLLFSLYVRPLKDIIQKYGIKRHQYADDSQLYVRLRLRGNISEDVHEDVNSMEQYLDEVRSWMAANRLKLNESKTEVLVISKNHHQNLLKEVPLKVGTYHI